MSLEIELSIKKANKLYRGGNLSEALRVLDNAIQRHPSHTGLKKLCNRMSNTVVHAERSALSARMEEELAVLFELGSWTRLRQKCKRLVDCGYASAILWNLYGVALRETAAPESAKAAFKKALSIDPGFALAYANLGNVLKDESRHSEARSILLEGIKIDPNSASCINSLGTLLQDLNDFKGAEKCFERVLEIKPHHASATYNLGGLHLRNKRFAKGWEMRESRWRCTGMQSTAISSSKPLWDGKPCDRLFVWAEQGIGDEVQFASCLEEIACMSTALTVSISKKSMSLFQRSFSPNILFVDRLQPFEDKNFDVHCPALTAVGYCRPELKDFEKSHHRYLLPDMELARDLRGVLERQADGKEIIGVSWRSQAARVGDNRSISLEALADQFSDDVFLLNLQYGDCQEDLSKLAANCGRKIFDSGIDNWEEIDKFTALIHACDRVVSVDNSTVHFAGALGKQCDVLLPLVADWRWGSPSCVTSYWYPSLKLHRQANLHDWSEALQSLRLSLGESSTF